MADKKKKRPGVWAKSLAKFLAGDDHCWYKLWYQSHYFYDKTPQTPEDRERMLGYIHQHSEIEKKRSDELRAAGYAVKNGRDGHFEVPGNTGDLTGECDIIAMKDGAALIVDAKSGKRREADSWQVRVYMWATVRDWLVAPRGVQGEIQYSDRREEVRPPQPEDVSLIGDYMRRATSAKQPAASPSKWECAFCNIASCPSRFNEDSAREKKTGSGGLF